MIKKIVISSLSLILIFINVSVYAADFSSSAVIENSGNKKYKAVRLTPEIYNNTNRNLSDLLIYDKDNESVPYFINSFTEGSSEFKKTYPLEMINSFVKDEYFYMDYSLKIPQNEDVIATSIKVGTQSTNFAKQIELYGGYDNIHWEKVQNDMLYDVGINQKLEISFDGVKKYIYYRFKIPNNLEKIEFNSVELSYNSIIKQKENFTADISPKFTVNEKDNTTIVKIAGLKNLKLNSITIETDSMFERKVTFDGSNSQMLYNLNFKDTAYKDTTLELNSYEVGNSAAELIIENKNDKPISIKKIDVEYFVDELIFDGSKGGNFNLKFGSNEVTTPPSYDIENYKQYVLKEGYDLLSIKEIKIQAQKPTQEQKDYKWIFNIVIIAIAIIMGIILILKLKKNTNEE